MKKQCSKTANADSSRKAKTESAFFMPEISGTLKAVTADASKEGDMT